MNEKSNRKVLLLFVATIIAVLNDSYGALCVVRCNFSDRNQVFGTDCLNSHTHSYKQTDTHNEIWPMKALEKKAKSSISENIWKSLKCCQWETDLELKKNWNKTIFITKTEFQEIIGRNVKYEPMFDFSMSI